MLDTQPPSPAAERYTSLVLIPSRERSQTHISGRWHRQGRIRACCVVHSKHLPPFDAARRKRRIHALARLRARGQLARWRADECTAVCDASCRGCARIVVHRPRHILCAVHNPPVLAARTSIAFPEPSCLRSFRDTLLMHHYISP